MRLALHRSRGDDQERVARGFAEGFGASGRQQRLVVLGTQVEQEAESVQQQAAHGMLGGLAQACRGTCECVPRDVARAKRLESRHATQGAQRELVRCPLRAGGSLVDQAERAFAERQALARTQVLQRGLRRFGVVAQCRQWFASLIEMRRELGCRDVDPRRALAFERDGDPSVQLDACRWRGAVEQCLAIQRVPERVVVVRHIDRLA